jgi:ComF family protein
MDFMLPPRCLVCGGFLGEDRRSMVCDTCAAGFELLRSPVCARCGRPFVSPYGGDHLCGACLTAPPIFDRARSAAVYGGVMREAIHLFKYRHRTALARPLAGILAAAGDIGSYDLLVPVPLHRRRLRRRGYNQALLLARELGRRCRVPVAVHGLQRIKRTRPQTSLTADERRRNVRGAVVCRGALFRNSRVLVIDDVYTSGSTVNECARVLKHSGAAVVDVLTLARVQPGRPC